MRKPLKPKAKSELSKIARELKLKGYDPIELINGKDSPQTGWPLSSNTLEEIDRWYGRTGAIRMRGCPDLIFIDIDFKRADIRDKLLRYWTARWPEFMAAVVRRWSGGVTLGLFARMVTKREHLKTHRYIEENDPAVKHMVEVFTCHTKQYVALWGVHSPGRVYSFEGTPLWDIPIGQLPEFSDEDINELLESAEQLLAATPGLVKDEQSRTGGTETVYDLEPGMLWRMADGTEITLGDFVDLYSGRDTWQAGYANIWDENSATADRVKAIVHHNSTDIVLWDSKHDINHQFKQVEEFTSEFADRIRKVIAANPTPTLFTAGYSVQDFWTHLPSHSYIYEPLGTLWPISTINAVLPHTQVGVSPRGKPIYRKPSSWLDQNKRVAQMIWAPGMPTIIHDRLLSSGGWIERHKTAAFNTYRPPVVQPGDAQEARRWLTLVEAVYPDDAGEIVAWFAHCVQHPDIKINHALVMVGAPGIGKDTIIEPLRYAVGPWNFRDISPHDVMSKWNDYMAASVVRISEARDLGEVNRFTFHEKTKTMLASPPDTVRIEAKYERVDYVLNVANVLITTNHRYDGLYLPPDDRRHYVAGTEARRSDIDGDRKFFWIDLWRWYRNGGFAHVAEFLRSYDLEADSFDAKAPPRHTEAFTMMAGAAVSQETTELMDVLEVLGNPAITMLDQLRLNTGPRYELREWLDDRKNRAAFKHRLDACGYTMVQNAGRTDGLWIIGGKRQTLYGRMDMPPQDRQNAAAGFVREQEKIITKAKEEIDKLRPKKQ